MAPKKLQGGTNRIKNKIEFTTMKFFLQKYCEDDKLLNEVYKNLIVLKITDMNVPIRYWEIIHMCRKKLFEQENLEKLQNLILLCQFRDIF